MLVHAAAHIHSQWSYDGKWSLDRLAETFSRRGYQVLLMSEHQNGFDEDRRLQYRKACLAASNGKILLVPGMEYSDPSNTVHILVWGDVPFVNANVDICRLLRHVEDFGGAAVFAHPSRRNAWQLFDDSWKEHLIGIELWNRKMDGWAPSREAARLLEKSGVLPFVGLDFHDFRQFFPLALLLDMSSRQSQKRQSWPRSEANIVPPSFLARRQSAGRRDLA